MIGTIVETRIGRKFVVTNHAEGRDVFIDVTDTSKVPAYGTRVFSMLKQEEARKLAGGLLGNNVAVITDLPEATLGAWDSRVHAGNADRPVYSDPEKIEETAKNLLAIAKFIRKANAEKEAAAEAQKAKEAEAALAELEKQVKLTERRDALATKFRGYKSTYSNSSSIFMKSIDRIIELEDAAALTV